MPETEKEIITKNKNQTNKQNKTIIFFSFFQESTSNIKKGKKVLISLHCLNR